MSWLASGIGAGIGFMIGGPIGAGIGLFLGSSFTKKQRINKSQQNQTIFFVSLFSMLAKMAKADGVISTEEINSVNKFIITMRLDEEDKKVAMKIFNNAKDDDYSIYEYATQYKENVNLAMRKMIYSMLWEVAYADGVIEKREDSILRQIPNYLGLDSSFYDNFSAQFLGAVQDVDEHYKLLGCTSADSDAQIRKSYKRATSEYHPDKIQSKGLPKEFTKFANEQTKKINQAYKAIKKSRIAIN